MRFSVPCNAAFAFDCIRLGREPLEHCLRDIGEVISFLTLSEKLACEKSAVYNAALKSGLCETDVSSDGFNALVRTLQYKMAVKEPEHAVELRDFCLALSETTEGLR